MIKKSIKVFWDEVGSVCEEHQYYTMGDIQDYSKMFEMCKTANTDANIEEIVMNIADHTDMQKMQNESGCSYKECLSAIAYDIYEDAVHTFVEF